MYSSNRQKKENKIQSNAQAIHQGKADDKVQKSNNKEVSRAQSHLQNLANSFAVQRKEQVIGKTVVQRNAVLDKALKLKIHTMTAADSDGYEPILGPDEKKLIDKINEIRNLIKHSDNLDKRSDTRKYLSKAVSWIGKIDPTGIASALANAEKAIHYLEQGINLYKSLNKGEAKPLIEKANPKSTYGTF